MRIYKPQLMWMFSEFLRKNKSHGVEMEKQRSFRQFNKKLTGAQKAKNKFWEAQAIAGDLGENRKSFEEKQSRLAKIEGLELKWDFEQRRSGWNKSENKAACFERGHTDRFKAQCPIWIKKKEKRRQEGKTGKGEKGKGKGKGGEVSNACVFRR